MKHLVKLSDGVLHISVNVLTGVKFSRTDEKGKTLGEFTISLRDVKHLKDLLKNLPIG